MSNDNAVFINGLEVISVSPNENGDWYVVFKIPKVKRGIKGKNKGKVDEVLILGIPKAKFPEWCEKNGVVVREL